MRIATAGLVVALSFGATGCTTGASKASRPVITPAQARAFVASFWPMREKALAEQDAIAIGRLETGAAGLIDQATNQDLLARSPFRSVARVRDHRQIMVFVPRQSTYPATFLAEVLTTYYDQSQGALKQLLTFTKRDAASPWLLALDATATNLDIDPAGMSDTFDPPPPDLPGVDPESFPQDLAEYWNSWWQTGHESPTPPFLAGYWTTERGALIAESGPGRIDPGCGCKTTLKYTPDKDVKPIVFNVQSGALLACFAIRIDESHTPLTGYLRQGAGRNEWGGQLPPGLYRRIDQVAIREACIHASPAQGGVLEVLGGPDEDISIQGTPAKPPLPASVASA